MNRLIDENTAQALRQSEWHEAPEDWRTLLGGKAQPTVVGGQTFCVVLLQDIYVWASYLEETENHAAIESFTGSICYKKANKK